MLLSKRTYETDQSQRINTFKTFSYSLKGQNFIFTANLCDDSVILFAEEEMKIEEKYYKTILTFNDFSLLGKPFKICDNIKEASKTLKFYIEQALKGEENFEITLQQKEVNSLELYMKVMLAEKECSFSIRLESVRKQKEDLIKDLRKIVDICIQKFGKKCILEELYKNMNETVNIMGNFSSHWKEGPNYTLSESKMIAKKISENNCSATVIANKPLPKNSIISWKIRLNNFESKYGLCIGVSPYNIDQKVEDNYNYINCWTLECANSLLYLRSSKSSNYRETSDNQKRLNNNDIITVTMDTKKGILSFAVNNNDYGIACSTIPTDIDIVPVVLMYRQFDCIELVK